MQVKDRFQTEHEELDAVLRSGIFNRAPNLARFLQYVCECHFRGEDAQIKEYNIAVEALGREAIFDQKKDSIVRVEAHRLRKRLSEFYASEGALHPLRIEIPSGQYAPLFVPNVTPEAVPEPQVPAPQPAELSRVLLENPVAPATPLPSRNRWIAVIVTVGVVVAVLVLWQLQRRAADEAWTGPAVAPLPTDVRFVAGYVGPPFRDRAGRTWQPDAFFKGGHSRIIPASQYIAFAPDPAFPRTYREGRFRYDIPLRSVAYEVHLYFAETKFGGGNPGGDGGHTFSANINGRTVFGTELAAAAGVNRMYQCVAKDVWPAKDGKIHLEFVPGFDDAVLSAAEILQSVPGRIRPIRFVARPSSVTDANGAVWLADQYGEGGHFVERRDSVSEGAARMLYESERYGGFVYRIPVAPGKYRVSLYFAETYFGTPIAMQGDRTTTAGGRLFNVVAEGRTLLKNFDVASEAGGPNRGIVRTFDDLEPNPQGEIVLTFQPVRNFAEINAIEIVETE